jgi:hypothetical protein
MISDPGDDAAIISLVYLQYSATNMPINAPFSSRIVFYSPQFFKLMQKMCQVLSE